MQHVVLTLGAAGAALAILERQTASLGTGSGRSAEPTGGWCMIRITHMPVRSPACGSLQLLQCPEWVLIQLQRKGALALGTQDGT